MTTAVIDQYMRAALVEAQEAFEQGEVPVGAVVVLNGKIVGQGHNQRERLADPTAHAEILALRQAAQACGSWRLSGADMYVTLEPCTMCAGAIVLARVRRLFFGADDPKAGAVVSLFRILDDNRLNHTVEVFKGVLEDECSGMLSRFFATKR
ncbi:MAG TPA: tRNA adenosine(34) deaminase TadA [bacterium]|nr:tRNA adenosine(34) deaminase TadA [bacterium]